MKAVIKQRVEITLFSSVISYNSSTGGSGSFVDGKCAEISNGL